MAPFRMVEKEQEKKDDNVTKKERQKRILGKQTSEGYKPDKDEEIELRGD